jgi:ceramide glucosyltransferase
MTIAVLLHPLGWVAGAAALAGAAYTVLAAGLAGRFMRTRPAASAAPVPVTILKPLHRDEARLALNLESFCTQDYAGPVQIVFGVQDRGDPALKTVQALKRRHPDLDCAVVADPRRHGSNAKISNLVNMLPAARHDVLVLSDSDIAVPPGWLTAVTAALAEPGTGLVSCFYTGRAAGPGLWPRLSAMGTSYDFLPGAILAWSLRMAEPCMGSTIALKRRTLEAIGGFAAFADYLADDYEMGRAVRGEGLRIGLPPLAVAHTAAEASLGALWRHDLRWRRTIRTVAPEGHLGSIVTFCLPLGLIAVPLLGFSPPSLAVAGLALAARTFLKYRIDAIFGAPAGPFWLLPARDILSFAVFAASLFGRRVHWRGGRFAVEPSGAMSQS